MNKEICGAECSDGSKCQNPKGSCPWHDKDGNRTDKAPGRKGKYNESRVKQILDAARDGLPLKSCARAGNISEDTLYRWIEEKEEFSERLKKARTEAERELARKVKKQDPRYVLTRSFMWDKPSADTEINVNQTQVSQDPYEKLRDLYEEKMKKQKEKRTGLKVKKDEE